MPIRRIKINRILVPTDFSDLALDASCYAGRFAGIVKADVMLIHITESPLLGEALAAAEAHLVDQQEAMRKRVDMDPSVNWQTKVVHGKVGEQVARVADEEAIDLVIMGTRGSKSISRFKRFFLDTNAQRTVAMCRVPVLTLREIPDPFRLRDILLPLDLTQQTHRKVHFAINLAKLFDARLHLVAVSHFVESLRGQDERLEEHMRAQEETIRAAGLEVSTEIIRHDSVAHSVVTYAEEIDADLIIILTARENRLDSLLMGSRAGRVIGTARRPVLSLHPRDLDGLLAG